MLPLLFPPPSQWLASQSRRTAMLGHRSQLPLDCQPPQMDSVRQYQGMGRAGDARGATVCKNST
eukprot:3300558-Amphidinium_carterae.1